jgi:sulfatase maturation enzyme AslB (radical SAM superfamily)
MENNSLPIQIPCEQCIVKVMCKNPCEELDLFIKENTLSSTNQGCVPYCLRMERVTINRNAIRKKGDGSVCLFLKRPDYESM